MIESPPETLIDSPAEVPAEPLAVQPEDVLNESPEDEVLALAVHEPAVATPPTVSPATDWAAAIRANRTLPHSVREALVSSLNAEGAVSAEEPRLPLSTVSRLLEQATPNWLASRAVAAQPLEHSGGEAFFAESPGELSDEQARSLALRQLARAGFAKRG